jgi:hypothetical protein
MRNHYCLLRVHNQPGKRKRSVLELTDQPEARLLALNLDLIPTVTRDCNSAPQAAAALWQPLVLVGPMRLREDAEVFLQEWNVTGGRSLEKRCDTADKLAQKHGYACYTLRAGVENDVEEEGDSEVFELDALPFPRRIYVSMYRRLALAEGRPATRPPKRKREASPDTNVPAGTLKRRRKE